MATAMDPDHSPTQATSYHGNRTPWQQKLQIAKEHKAEGNELYKAKSYKAAIRKYHHALMYIKGIDSAQDSKSLLQNFGAAGDMDADLTDEGKQESCNMKRDCYNNLAACILLTEAPAYDRVLLYSDKVLELFPSNIKATYRKGVSLYHLKNTDEALHVLTKASHLPGGDKDANIRKYLKLCAEDLTQQDKKMKDTCRAMFDGMSIDDSADSHQPQHQNGSMDT